MSEPDAKTVRARVAVKPSRQPVPGPKRPKGGLLQRFVDWGMSLFDSDDDEPEVPRHKRTERADATVARVRQVNKTSCGVAAAAMFARQKHDVVKAFMFPIAKRSYGTFYEDVWRAFRHFGVEHEEVVHKFTRWEDIPNHALVGVRWLSGKQRDHWVVYQRLPRGKFRVLDPGSWDETLTMTNLEECEGVDYALATPRTREQGPLPVRSVPRKAQAPRSPKKAAKKARVAKS